MTNSYQLIDSGNFQKLEQIGQYRFVRPSPQAVWRPRLPASGGERWMRNLRFSGGDGKWTIHVVRWITLDDKLRWYWLNLRGLISAIWALAEQVKNWQTIRSLCEGQDYNVLNLFAYTGGSTLAASQGGAHVVHVDASKTSVVGS